MSEPTWLDFIKHNCVTYEYNCAFVQLRGLGRPTEQKISSFYVLADSSQHETKHNTIMARKAFLSLQLKAMKHFTIGDFNLPKDADLPLYRKNLTTFHIVLKIICLITVFDGTISSENLSKFSLNFTEFANVLLGVIKYGILVSNRDKLYRLIKMIEVDRLSYSDDDRFMETGTGATRKVLLTYLGFTLIACVGYYTPSFMARDVEGDSKWSVVSMYTPYDFYIKERYGVIEIALNLLLIYQIYCHIFIDLFSASIFIFISRQFKTVAYLFETIQFCEQRKVNCLRRNMNSGIPQLDHEGRPAMPGDLKNAIVYHSHLLDCAHDIQYVWRYIFFFQILEICIPMCLCMYLVVHTLNFTYDEIWDTLSHLNLLVFLLYQLFLMTTCADETRQEALLVSEGAYFSNWTEGSVASRKELLNVIQRANKPLPFSALGVCAVDMETYINIIRTAYGAFTLMRNFI